MRDGDTIAAISTAPGRGGVAVVRVSGPDAWEVARKVTGRQIAASCAGRFFFCDFGGADSGLLLVFKAPHSYTGEDAVELQCHGGSVAPRRVLEACFAAGARLARRGEFTERAFLNGKLDLSAAEAVIDLVDARTDRAAEDAQARLRGALSARYESLYGAALGLSSRLEHMLDVDEGELPPGALEDVARDVAALVLQIETLLATAHEGRLLREGALVVLAGAPNAGKSSLMNALLGERRAIVSDEAGTTRDTIEEGLDVDGWPVRLVDTAGLRDASNAVEAEGVRRAGEQIGRADMVIALDCDIPGAMRIHAKCDLDDDATHLRVSAKTGEGLDALKAAIAKRLGEIAGTSSECGAAGDVTARQVSLLEAAKSALSGADVGEPVLAANALRRAAEALGEIVGKTYSADLLNAIFSRFCVGK